MSRSDQSDERKDTGAGKPEDSKPRAASPRPAAEQDAPEPVRPETIREAKGQAVKDQKDPPKAEGDRDEVDEQNQGG